jgi:hypothetical protein
MWGKEIDAEINVVLVQVKPYWQQSKQEPATVNRKNTDSLSTTCSTIVFSFWFYLKVRYTWLAKIAVAGAGL